MQTFYLFIYLFNQEGPVEIQYLFVTKLQRNTYLHTMNKHKTPFSKNNTNPSHLLKHAHVCFYINRL